MARNSKTDELFEMLRARGLRKQVARALSDAAGAGRSGAAASQEAALRMVADLRKLADDLEGRLTGRTRSRSEAAKKAAQTRKRKATARSVAAKKGAATRRRSGSATKPGSSTSKPASSATKRAASAAKRGSSTTKRSSSSSGGTRRRGSAKKT